MPSDTPLRMSALRALLGRVYASMRLITITRANDVLVLTVVFARQPTESELEDVSDAAAEIIADFPDAARIHESISVSTDEITLEDPFVAGWIYRRAE